jgi:hypothetical protein
MAERRSAARQKSFLRGCIYFNNKRSAVDCLIRDISPLGARLIFSDSVSVPDAFDLYVAQKEQSLRARVQWRFGDEVGVAFGKAGRAPEADASPDAEDLIGRMAKLEHEVAALRRAVKRLQAAVPAADPDAA